MPETESNNVPRTPEEPTPQQVLEEMNRCEPYKAADIHEEFPDVSRWTIQRRLDALHESEKIQKKKHADDSVSWYVRPDGE